MFLFTAGIPFFWWDQSSISKFSSEWENDSLTYGFEFAFRPVENIIHFFFLHMFGVITVPFRLLKAIAAASVVVFIYFFVEKYTGEKKIAMIAGFFYLTVSAVLQSVMLIYDFEIIAQLLLLISVYYFLRAWEKEKTAWKEIFLFMVFVYLALLTKESAKVFVGVITIFIVFNAIALQNWKKALYFSIPTGVLIFLATNPGILLGLKSPSSDSLIQVMFSWFKIQNFFFFAEYLFISSFGILIILVIISISIIHNWINKRDELKNVSINILQFKQSIQKENSVIFFGLWFLIAGFLTILTPMDRRYAVVPILPFTIFSFIYIAKSYQKYVTYKRVVHFIFILLLCITLVVNVGMSIKYRYGFGNFFINLDESHIFAEQNYNNSIFIYTDTISHYYNFFGLSETNNEFFEYHQFNNSLLKNKSILLFALNNPLQTKEKQEATLEKSFVKGPHCFELYKLGEKEMRRVYLEETDENSEDQEWKYSFLEETTISYCSIEIETEFFIPQKIEITLVGRNENVTTIVSPPLGKQKNCEYLCSFSNESIIGIKVKTKNSIVNEVYNAEVHLIEK